MANAPIRHETQHQKSSPTHNARFIEGSTLRHVVMMTLSNAVGIISIFIVDLIDLYFLSLLGEESIVAGVGFATAVLSFMTAIGIGLLVAMSVLVSQRIGAKQEHEAKVVGTSILVFSFVISLVFVAFTLGFLTTFLQWLGATGQSLSHAQTYAYIILPSVPFLVLGMVGGANLRAVGDARRSMNATLIGAIVNLILDPIFIFVLDLGLVGAAIATVISRFAIVLYALNGVMRVHQMVVWISVRQCLAQIMPILTYALPAMLSNLATPIGNAFVSASMAKYGDSAMAAIAVIGRIVFVAFGVVYALSGAVGPIVGQNYGAKLMLRVRGTHLDAMIFAFASVVFASGLLYVAQDWLVIQFHLSGEAAHLVKLFCTGVSLLFVFDAVIFSTNATFNSIGKPYYATATNYARVLLGVIPLTWLGAQFYHAEGVLIGSMLGTGLIALPVTWYCRKLLRTLVTT